MSELYDILTETPPTKVVLLALDQGLWDCERSLAELSALCEANHMEAVAQITQKRQTTETGIVLGSGKLEEASLAAQTLGAECAVFDGELTGSQIRNISNALGGLEVIDRTMLILEIFRSRAVTNEGKLQTELALLRYRLPRLQGMGEALSRQGGGGGGGGGARRGAGETKLELDRRHVHARIDALAEKLAEMEKRRGESRKARAKTGMPVVSLVGYTNVGKIQPDECPVRPQRSRGRHAVCHPGPHQPEAGSAQRHGRSAGGHGRLCLPPAPQSGGGLQIHAGGSRMV